MTWAGWPFQADRSDIGMKVLCIIPPYVPSYFNSGHHLPVFQVAAYLRRSTTADVTAIDCAALNATWRDICRLLARRFDAILMLNDYDAIDGFGRFVQYAREISPASRLATFGRASRDVPAFFDRFGLDGIGSGGDYELSMRAFLDYVVDGRTPSGLRVPTSKGAYRTHPVAVWLPAEEWVLPEVSEIPYDAYARLYEDDLNKFCGIPRRKELVVPVARGCPVGCSFCDVPRQQGLRERRLSVERVVEYIRSTFDRDDFEYVSFYAPTFTLKRNWVLEMCAALRASGPNIPWKCVTTVAHLDEALIRTMADAGCVRISVGVETFAIEAAAHLPRIKRESRAAFEAVANYCRAAGIELNCFLMLGLPGESPNQAVATMNSLIQDGHRVRPTVFTPYDQMRNDMSTTDAAGFNRQLFGQEGPSRQERDFLYRALYANEADVATKVQERVPGRGVPFVRTSF
jgi:radical SAM superfamily enzyme YgiQ (UPF0313 family)